MRDTIRLQSYSIDPSAAKNLAENVGIMIALAASEPDPQTGKAQLGEIYTDLATSEKICEELLSAIKASKKRTLKEINNKVIDDHHITCM